MQHISIKDLKIYSKEILLDTETPISLFLKARTLSPYSFLLESVEEGNNIGRYSIVGWGRVKSFVAYSDKILVDDVATESTDLFENLRQFILDYKLEEAGEFNGFYGFLGYDSVYQIESTITENPKYGDLPIAYFFLPAVLAVFDKISHQVKFIFNSNYNDSINPDDLLREVLSVAISSEQYIETSDNYPQINNLESNLSQTEYEEIVSKAREYIFAGDIFQVVLSQRFQKDIKGDPFNIYRQLCSLNPSPYMFYINFGDDFSLMGTSPEIMLKKEQSLLTIRPIAGTRKKGVTLDQDLEREKDLLSDEKENAEHLMLVDLARNDLNRICDPATVKVVAFKTIERYSHVMHIVSSVTGRISADKDVIDAIKASFPAGTLSGAPKVRAMQIINELEQEPRQIYGGMVGYFDFAGNFDSCITIRSILVRDDKAYFQAGAGIVADSDPTFEFEETKMKAGAMAKAIQLSVG